MHRRSLIQVALAAPLLQACGSRRPVRLAYLGGLSGKFADLGSEQRNAVLLTLEQFNAQTPLASGAIELIEGDDAQDPARGAAALRALAAQDPVAVIGPATSSIGMALVPLAAELGLLLVSATCTSSRLSGRDDALVRVCSDTAVYGAAAARAHLDQLKVKRVSTLADLANADYTSTWVDAYAGMMKARNAPAPRRVEFMSTQAPDHPALAEQLLADDPELVALCCSAVDAALLIQRLRALRPGLLIAASAWSTTGRTLELAGRAADGVVFEQYYNPSSDNPVFVRFLKDFERRFRQPASFAAVLASDATRLVLGALQRGATRQTLKAELIGRSHQGLQSTVTLDANGDTQRPGVFVIARNGRFEPTGWER